MWLLLVWRHNPRLRAGHPHGACQVRKVSMQHIKATRLLLHPLCRWQSLTALWPHWPHLRRKAECQIHWPCRINLKQDDRASTILRVIRRKHDLPHRERDMRIRDHRVIGKHLDLSCGGVQVDWHGVAFDIGTNAEMAEHLDRQHPCLKRPFLLPEKHAACPCNSKRFTRLNVPPDGQA